MSYPLVWLAYLANSPEVVVKNNSLLEEEELAVLWLINIIIHSVSDPNLVL